MLEEMNDGMKSRHGKELMYYVMVTVEERLFCLIHQIVSDAEMRIGDERGEMIKVTDD